MRSDEPVAEKKRRNVGLIVLVGVLAVSFVINTWSYYQLRELSVRLETVQQENIELKKSLEILETQIKEHPVGIEEGAWIYSVGVYVENDVTKGMVLKIYAKFIPGTGSVLIKTTPKMGIAIQESAETAYAVAQRVTGVNARDLDVIITIASNKTLNILDGPSAGAAITALLASALTGKEIRTDVIATGAISPDGSITKVGGLIAKAEAAYNNGAKIFAVPKGQLTDTIYVKETKQYGFMTITEIKPVVVNIEDYLKEKGCNITVIETATINDLLSLLMA